MKGLTSLRDIKLFKESFSKLCVGNQMSDEEQEYILSTALVFIKYYNADNRLLSYLDIAYYIILKYSLSYNNYEPLLDFSSQFGFYPITQWIRENKIPEESIFDNIEMSAIEKFFKNELGNYTETLEQNSQRINLIESSDNEMSYIAPTSFGKSQVIQEYLQKHNNKYDKVGVIVPSKSLLVQTYKDLRNSNLNYKFLLHDEMYFGEQNVIGILTQERATSLIRRKNFIYDILFIDEAHNLLSRDDRSLVLARFIQAAKQLNPNIKIVYLSPLVSDSKNLIIGKNAIISEYEIKFNMKSYEVFLLSFNNQLFMYDRFTKSMYQSSNEAGYYECIIKYSLKKNFIYARRPILVEKLAKELYIKLSKIKIDSELNEIIQTLKTEVHEKFYNTQTLEKGILYIHGQMPDLIKEFLEYCFKRVNSIRYIVANSVILEGINLPIDRLFITNTRQLYGKELTNLIGRVNRLNYVFEENNLSKLIPKVFFLDHKEFNAGSESMISKIELLSKRTFKDDIDNPILEEYTDIKKEDKDIYEQNKVLIDSLVTPSKSLEDYILSLIVENQISEFYQYSYLYKKKMSFDNQKILAKKIFDKLVFYRENLLKNEMNLLDKINYFFVENLMNDYPQNDKAISRLEHQYTREFYTLFITKIIKFPLRERINWFYNDFRHRVKNNRGTLLYIGSSYGEVNWESSSYNYNQNVYIDLSSKLDHELINLALVKLKLEEEFVSFKFSKMILMLYDLDVITEDEYNIYVYGTTDANIINYCKQGLSISCVTKLIEDKQIENIALNPYGNIIVVDSQFWDYVENQSQLFQFELRKYIFKD